MAVTDGTAPFIARIAFRVRQLEREVAVGCSVNRIRDMQESRLSEPE